MVTGTGAGGRDGRRARCRAAARRCTGSAEPPPLRVTLGTGQPKFMSTWSTPTLVDQEAHGLAERAGVRAVELHRAGGLGAVEAQHRSVRALRSTSARAVIISDT